MKIKDNPQPGKTVLQNKNLIKNLNSQKLQNNTAVIKT